MYNNNNSFGNQTVQEPCAEQTLILIVVLRGEAVRVQITTERAPVWSQNTVTPATVIRTGW